MPVVGLLFIIAAWLVQIKSVGTQKKEVSPFFLALYISGAVMLVIDGYSRGALFLAALNLISVTLTGYLFIRLTHSRHKKHA